MYFDHLFTVEAIKTRYRELAFMHHPDRGGDTRTMQDVNAAYHAALARVDGSTSRGDDNQQHTYHYDASREQELIDKIAELITAGILSYADMYLIGVWIWIIGDTKPIKETLKSAGCRWHQKRAAWYWQNQPYRGYNKRASLGDLAAKYGAKKFEEKSA